MFEDLTQGLCEKGWAEFQALERAGGAAEALESGEFQTAVRTAAAALARDVARLKAPITGVSAHPDLGEAPIEVTRRRVRRVVVFTGESFAPPLDALTRSPRPFEALRDAAEALARAAKDFSRRDRRACRAFAPRLVCARICLKRAASRPRPIRGATEAAVSAERFRASGARFACLCGSDEDYAAKAADFAAALKSAGADHVDPRGPAGRARSCLARRRASTISCSPARMRSPF